MREKINICRYFTGKLEGIGPLGRASRAWEENIKCVLKDKIEICELDLSGSGQGPVTRSFQRVNLSKGSIKLVKVIY